MKVVFISTRTSPTNVTKHVLLISSYFTTIPGGRAAGRPAGSNENKTNSVQLSLAGAWTELGNKEQFKLGYI